MKVFYCRVSTVLQNEARQVKMCEDVKAEKLFVDKASGKNTDRPKLKEMLSFIREGDIVIVESISRLARNTKDLLCIVDTITSKGADLVSLKENIDTSTPQGKCMLTVFGALAQFERELINERTLEGVAIAKEEGKYKGKPKKKIDEQAFRRECKKWRDGKQTAVQTMDALGLRPNTFYRRVKEFAV